jgi:glycerate kinase
MAHGCPNAEVVLLPVADGGDGTAAAAIAAGEVPRCSQTTTRWGLIQKVVTELSNPDRVGLHP